MAIYNLHICHALPESLVLSLFPKTTGGQGSSVEKICYENIEGLIAGLKHLSVKDDTLADLRLALKRRAPFTISEIPATADDLAGLRPTP